MSKTLFVAIVCCVAFTGVAFADDTWTPTVNFSRGDASAIKVFEPDGYKASVTVGGETQADSVPAVLRVPNADDFVVVTITAPSGAKWSKKIETKKFKITELRVKHQAAAQPAKGGAKRKFFGKFAMSQKAPCKDEPGVNTKIAFVSPDGALAASFVMQSYKPFTGEVPEGDYSVRTFRIEPDGTETYRNTRSASITRDGWTATVFCSAKGGGVDITVK